MITARIFNIQAMSTEDGPGIRTTVFMKGCPMQCIWCQNPEGLSTRVHLVHDTLRCIGCGSCRNQCTEQALTSTEKGFVFAEKCRQCLSCANACPAAAIRVIGTDVTVEELRAKLLADRPFYESSGGGVTFSGGECLLHHQFLKNIIPLLQADGVHVCLDTSGYVAAEIFRTTVVLADLVLYDLKIMRDEEHRRHTGVSNALVLENAAWLSTSGLPVWVRIPVIPGYTDGDENIGSLAGFIREQMMPAVKRVDLLGFNDLCAHDYEKLGMRFVLPGTPRVDEATMLRHKNVLTAAGVETVTISNYVEGG